MALSFRKVLPRRGRLHCVHHCRSDCPMHLSTNEYQIRSQALMRYRKRAQPVSVVFLSEKERKRAQPVQGRSDYPPPCGNETHDVSKRCCSIARHRLLLEEVLPRRGRLHCLHQCHSDYPMHLWANENQIRSHALMRYRKRAQPVSVVFLSEKEQKRAQPATVAQPRRRRLGNETHDDPKCCCAVARHRLLLEEVLPRRGRLHCVCRGRSGLLVDDWHDARKRFLALARDTNLG